MPVAPAGQPGAELVQYARGRTIFVLPEPSQEKFIAKRERGGQGVGEIDRCAICEGRAPRCVSGLLPPFARHRGLCGSFPGGMPAIGPWGDPGERFEGRWEGYGNGVEPER
ncbi:MAG: hypothetical protein KatS3mg111_2710 [Pirellulaceae bacterium]|nr:MAG: hypothetical protein KatS3mg111_2710 [Pirellulaceae bacterium]